MLKTHNLTKTMMIVFLSVALYGCSNSDDKKVSIGRSTGPHIKDEKPKEETPLSEVSRADSILFHNVDGSFEISPGLIYTRNNGSVHIHQADSSDAVVDAF